MPRKGTSSKFNRVKKDITKGTDASGAGETETTAGDGRGPPGRRQGDRSGGEQEVLGGSGQDDSLVQARAAS